MDEILKDDRFKHIAKDSRFKLMPKNERKFKIDQRFKKMFHDKKFKLKYTVDKRGRPTNTSTNDNLKKYYQLPSDEEDDEEDENKAKTSAQVKQDEPESEPEEESENQSEKEESGEESDDDDVDDDDDESSAQEDEAEIPWNELDRDTVREEKTSSRLAVCNMDWDRIKAMDLYVLFNSFKPAQGVIKSIKIYLSEYGKERIEYEKMHGPKELTESEAANKAMNGQESPESSDSEDLADDDSDDFDRRKLRIYQFNRLRYYYAVIECDTVETAEKIYSECDGMEYESSCNRIDLRFIPDDEIFDEKDVREACTEAPDPITYKPNLYSTTALNQTRVECTWDETPRDRLALTMKKYTEEDLKNSNFKGILATSSEEEDNDQEEIEVKIDKVEEKKPPENETEEERIRRYRELLLGVDKKSQKQRDADLEFDWDGGIKEDGFNELLFNQKKKPNKKHSKRNLDSQKELTEEEKKEQAQLSMLTMDDEDNKAHFNLDDLLIDKKKSGKNKSKKSQGGEENKKADDDFKLNINDPRFQAIFTSHKFNIDPSDQSFKKTKAMEQLLDEKIKRLEKEKPEERSEKEVAAEEKINKASEESLLIRSIKSKTEVLKRKNEESKQKFQKIKTKKF